MKSITMKKSNIILISVLCVFIISIIIIQLHLKNALTNITENNIKLDYNNFNTLDIGDGWNINLVQAKDSKVSVLEDSIKNFISLDGNILKFENIKNNKEKIKVEITSVAINKINITGHSFLRYSTDYVDSIFITQTEKSKIIIQNGKDELESDIEDEPGLINFASVILSNQSKLQVYNNVNSLTGELRDSSYCQFKEQINFTHFSKSETSHLRSW